MNNKKQDKDVTLWVSIAMAAVLFFPIYGQMFTSCKSEKAVLVEGHDAEYWHKMFLQEREELMCWRDMCHSYWQYLDYDDRENHLGHGNFFLDVISEGDAYDRLCEINGGDFEDFFFMW